jgi:hypothetical protein
VRGGGEGGRNDPNIVCTYEQKKIKKIILVHESVFPAFRKVLVPSAWVISAYSSMNE